MQRWKRTEASSGGEERSITDFDTESKDAEKRKDVTTFSVSHSKHIHQPATDPRLIYRQGRGTKIKNKCIYPVMLTKLRPFLFDLTQFSTEGEDDDEEGGSVTLSGHYPIRQPGSPSIREPQQLVCTRPIFAPSCRMNDRLPLPLLFGFALLFFSFSFFF